MTAHEHTGVWISSQPLDANEGARGDHLLAIDVADSAVSQIERHEWIEEGKGYREFLVPAAVVNVVGIVSLLEIDAKPAWAPAR